MPPGEQPSRGPHALSIQTAVGRARQQTHCVTCEPSHGRVAWRGCHPVEASAPELDHLDAASDPSPRSWGRRQNVPDRSQPWSTASTTPLVTPLQAGPSCPLGWAHWAQAQMASRPVPSTHRCVLCAPEPALLQAQPGGTEQHLDVDQLPLSFCINIPVRCTLPSCPFHR